jgi:hypothetical protein
MRRPASRLFRNPTRGGWLAVLNCALWLLFVCIVPFVPEPWSIPAVILVWLLSPPGVGCLVILPMAGGIDPVPPGHAVIAGVATGANAFAWGYGLSWLMSLAGRRRERAHARLQQSVEPAAYPAAEPTSTSRW